MDRRTGKLALLLTLVWAIGPVTSWANEGDDQYAVAASHYRQRHWQMAVDEFTTFLNDYPYHTKIAHALFFSGEAHVQLRQYDQAHIKFKTFLAKDVDHPFHSQALLRVGECSYLLGRYDEAKDDLENFRRRYPRDPLNEFALLYLGEMASMAGDAETAERWFSDALEQFPNGKTRDDCRFNLARIWEEQGQIERAKSVFQELSKKEQAPLADKAHFQLGACKYSQQDYVGAIESFDEFAERFPDNPLRDKAVLSKGWALFHLKRHGEAVETFERITGSENVGLSAAYWLGLSHKAQEHWEEAANILVDAASRAGDDPSKAAMHFHAGEALLHAGRPDEAIAQFRQVDSSGSPGEWSDDALLGQMRCHWKKGDCAAVNRLAAAFARQFPDSELTDEVDRTHARALLDDGNHADAVAILEDLSRRNNGRGATDEDRYLLALAYQRAERHDDAVKTVDRLGTSEVETLSAGSLWIKASSLMSESRFQEAIGPLEQYVKTDPDDAQTAAALGRLAICYARADQMKQAREAYDLLVARDLEKSLTLPTTRHLAEAVFAGGDYEWARGLFDSLAATDNPPEEQVAGASGKAWCQFKTGDLDSAVAGFHDVLTRFPNHTLAAEAALVRGRILEQLKRVDPALAMYETVIDKYATSPSMPAALLAAARLQDRLQQDPQAAAKYERLTADFPQFAERDAALYEWAFVLDDLKQPEAAAKTLARLRREHPQSEFVADATYRLAQHALQAKDFSQANALIDEVVAADKDAELVFRAIYLRGEVAAAQQQWDEVIASMRRVTKEYPESLLKLPAEYWIAEAHFRQQKYVQAGILFDELSRLTAESEESWRANVALRRAQCLAHQCDWQKAADVASTIATDFPDFALLYEADYVIGRSFAAQGKFDDARSAYRRVVRSPQGAKTETAAIAQWMIGESYFHQKDYQAAVREYLRLEILYAYPTWQAGALLQAGKCYEQLGQAAEAQEMYSRIVQSYANTTFSDDAAKRLGSLPTDGTEKLR